MYLQHFFKDLLRNTNIELSEAKQNFSVEMNESDAINQKL